MDAGIEFLTTFLKNRISEPQFFSGRVRSGRWLAKMRKIIAQCELITPMNLKFINFWIGPLILKNALFNLIYEHANARIVAQQGEFYRCRLLLLHYMNWEYMH